MAEINRQRDVAIELVGSRKSSSVKDAAGDTWTRTDRYTWAWDFGRDHQKSSPFEDFLKAKDAQYRDAERQEAARRMEYLFKVS